MAGMDFSFTVSVSGAGELEELAAAARDAEHALEGARDADLELGASSADAAAGIAAQAAAMDAAKVSAGRLRDEHGRYISVAAEAERASRDLGAGLRDVVAPAADDTSAAMRDLERSARLMGLGSSEASNSAALAMHDYESRLASARSVAQDAERGINDLQNATSKSEISAIGAGHGLKVMESGIKDAEKAAGDAADAGSGMSKLTGLLGPAAMPAGIGALVVGVAAAAPALVSAGLGFASFGALAAPALYKVKQGLSGVTYAQQQYTLARGVEARNPTKAQPGRRAAGPGRAEVHLAQMPLRSRLRSGRSRGLSGPGEAGPQVRHPAVGPGGPAEGHGDRPGPRAVDRDPGQGRRAGDLALPGRYRPRGEVAGSASSSTRWARRSARPCGR